MRAFMEKVRAEAERRGIPYIRADFSQLGDEYYRDYNHLNERGVMRYAKMLAPLLAQAKRGRA